MEIKKVFAQLKYLYKTVSYFMSANMGLSFIHEYCFLFVILHISHGTILSTLSHADFKNRFKSQIYS
jgi:hypothetical protein